MSIDLNREYSDIAISFAGNGSFFADSRCALEMSVKQFFYSSSEPKIFAVDIMFAIKFYVEFAGVSIKH